MSHAESFKSDWLNKQKHYRIGDFGGRVMMSIQSHVLWNQCCAVQHVVSGWLTSKAYRICPCTSYHRQWVFHWEKSAQLHWGLKLHLCFPFIPNTVTLIGENCQNTFIVIVRRKLFLKLVASPITPTSYISRWKRQVEFCLKKNQ